MVNTALILAGGMGTRLKSVVSEVPKPMAPINGIPFLEIQINYWISQGINNFILSVGYKKEIIINHFGLRFNNAEINYVVEENPLGTGGGILKALLEYNIKSPFLLLNGDTYFDISLETLWRFHTNKSANLTFSVFKSKNTTRYLGLDVDTNMKIRSSDLIKEHNDFRYVNGGVYIVDPKVLSNFKFDLNEQVSFESEIIPKLIKNKMSLYACEFNTKFIDIGIPEDYLSAQKIL